jgi:uncharacterized protein YbjT (DUF2867 family)
MLDIAMYVVMGATGHVGGSVATTLLDAGQQVIAITRDASHAQHLSEQGAEIATLDIRDSTALRDVFRRGQRGFLLNPPAPPSGDTDREEHASLQAIVSALDGSGLEKIVVASTYGARPGDRIGDLSVLYDFEQAIEAQPISATIQRGAYYMSNWDALLDAARAGKLPTMFPAEMTIPMVAPHDLGVAAARRLMEPAPEGRELRFVEGPERYSANDVADAFSAALGKPVEVEVTPREHWFDAYKALGFSDAAAEAFARMMAVNLDGVELPLKVDRGATSLQAYVDALVRKDEERRS